MTKRTNPARDIADETFAALAARVIEMMQDQPGTWARPWAVQAAEGMPRNAATGAPYTGGNWLHLLAAAIEAGHTSNEWATYKQWQSIGAQVRRGERSTVGVVWKPWEVEVDAIDPETGEPATTKRTRWIVRTFRVFNACQVDGYEAPTEAPALPDGATPDERADAWFASLPALDVRHGGSRAYYNHAADYVGMPDRAAFHTTEGYYSTLAHEVTHWSGHASRLNRPKHDRWGDDAYAYEELVAELGAVLITAGHLDMVEVTQRDDNEHAAYLASWVRQLTADPGAIWRAASDAERAARWLIAAADAAAPADTIAA